MLTGSFPINFRSENILIVPLLPSRRIEALDFCRPYEAESTEVMARLLESTENVYAVEYSGGLCGLLYLRNKRSVFYVLPFAAKREEREKKLAALFVKSFSCFIKDFNLFAVTGILSGAELIIDAVSKTDISKRKSSRSEYYLMQAGTYRRENLTNKSGFCIRKATAADTDKIFPLEKAFQWADVIPEGYTLSDEKIREKLAKTLSKENNKNYVLEAGGEILSKASINLTGENVEMISSVYTKESKRRLGYGSTIVNHLVRLICTRGKKAVLIARKTNSAAVNAYKKIGFNITGDFVICYWFEEK